MCFGLRRQLRTFGQLLEGPWVFFCALQAGYFNLSCLGLLLSLQSFQQLLQMNLKESKKNNSENKQTRPQNKPRSSILLLFPPLRFAGFFNADLLTSVSECLPDISWISWGTLEVVLQQLQGDKLVTLFRDPENYGRGFVVSLVLTKPTTNLLLFFRESDGQFLPQQVESLLLKMCLSPTALERWATWWSCGCPCSLQGDWTRWPLRVPSNPNHSTIIRARGKEGR